MNCPLCDTPLTESGACPNCGYGEEQALQEGSAEESCENVYTASARLEKYADLPGIFLTDEEDAEYEADGTRRSKHRGPIRWIQDSWRNADEKTRWNIRFATGTVGGTLLLFLILTLFYAPNAPAMTGKNSISMTNREFYIYYCSAYTSYLSSNTDSSGNTSVSFTNERSLDRQYYNLETGYSWQDYFMDQALQSAGLTETLACAAEKSGMGLSEDEEEALQERLDALAESAGGDLDTYLQSYYGGPVNTAVYTDYLRDSMLAQDYYESLYQAGTFTDDDILSYYQENSDDYTELTITDIPDVNVREILIVPVSDSQKAWDDAEEKANAALQQCLNSDDPEQTFLNLVPELSQDSGTNTNGGLLEEVYPGAIGGNFDAWCFDQTGREQGDLAVVMSPYGWHVVLFESYSDETYWKSVVESDMRTAQAQKQAAALYQAAKCKLTAFADVPRT